MGAAAAVTSTVMRAAGSHFPAFAISASSCSLDAETVIWMFTSTLTKYSCGVGPCQV